MLKIKSTLEGDTIYVVEDEATEPLLIKIEDVAEPTEEEKAEALRVLKEMEEKINKEKS